MLQTNRNNLKLLQCLSKLSLNRTKEFRLSVVHLTSMTTTPKQNSSLAIEDLKLKEVSLGGADTKAKNRQKLDLDLTFNNAKIAFKSKTNLDLLRAYLVFQLCSINFLVDNQKNLLNIARKILGSTLFKKLMKSTFYGHFVAGENQHDIRKNIENMMKHGVKSILDYSAELDLNAEHPSGKSLSTQLDMIVGENKRKLINNEEINIEKNVQIFTDCIDAVSHITNSTGLAAVKLTCLIRPAILFKFSSFLSKTDKSSSSEQFSWKNLVQMNKTQLKDMFFQNQSHLKENIEFSDEECAELHNMFLRIDEIVEHAVQKDVRIFVDAEQTYFQVGIHRITIELMRHFNKNKCFVLNTYQNYLKSAYDSVKRDVDLAIKENFCFGAKLVRGAYMEQERKRALDIGYADPINLDYESTTRTYERSLMYCLTKIKEQTNGRVCIMIASHNEESVKFALEKMSDLDIKPADRVVCFGQLLGMCDYISFYLGELGYSVYKYVPYGPVEEVLPYLSRRATENRGIFEKVKKEKRLILKEIFRRCKRMVI